MTITFGPESVPPEKRRIGVRIRADEEDDLWANAFAQSQPTQYGGWAQWFPLPSGSGDQLPNDAGFAIETVDDQPVDIEAFPANDGSSLHLTVHARYSVSYPRA